MVILPEYVKIYCHATRKKNVKKKKTRTSPVLNVSCLPLKCVEKTVVTCVIYIN